MNTREMSFVNFNGQEMQFVNFNGENVYEAWKSLHLSGVPPLTLPKCKGVPLLDYKIHGERVQSRLPEEYQQVEYIEATGTQYLEIDYIASGITSSKGKYQITDVSTGKMLFGSRPHAGAENTYAFNWGGGFPYKLYNSYGVPIQLQFEVDTDVHTFHKDKGYLYLDDNLLHGKEEKEFVTPYKMIVFGCNTGGTVGLFAPAKIYWLQFYDDDTLMVDLIPCYRKTDNVIGMYDTVNDIFYTNQGTGKFIKGRDVPNVDYPMEFESVGDRTKNLFNIRNIADTMVTNNYIEFYEDYSGFIMKSSTFGDGRSIGKLSALCPDLKVGDTFRISFETDAYRQGRDVNYFYLNTYGSSIFQGTSYRCTQEMLDSSVYAYRGITENAYIKNIQFEIGKTTTEYEPYGYKIPVKVSENLFDETTVVNGKYINSSGIETASQSLFRTDYFNVLPNTNYVLNFYSSNTNIVAFSWYDENKNFISRTSSSDVVGNNVNFLAQSPVNARYGICNILPGAIDVSITKEPIITNIYLNEPLRRLGEYADYVDFANGKVIRNICEQRAVYTAVVNFAKGFTTLLSKAALNTDSTKRYVRCNYMVGSNSLPTASKRAGKVFIGSIDTYVGFGETELFPIAGEQFPTEEEMQVFKNWLDSTNVLVYYVLKTPDEETIELPNIPTNKGTTVIEVDTSILPSNMEVVYKGKEV